MRRTFADYLQCNCNRPHITRSESNNNQYNYTLLSFISSTGFPPHTLISLSLSRCYVRESITFTRDSGLNVSTDQGPGLPAVWAWPKQKRVVVAFCMIQMFWRFSAWRIALKWNNNDKWKVVFELNTLDLKKHHDTPHASAPCMSSRKGSDVTGMAWGQTL